MQKLRIIIASILAGIGIFFGAAASLGAVTFTASTKPAGTYQNYTFFAATTTTATSTNVTDGGGYFALAGAKKAVLYFTHGGTATTSTTGQTFRIQTSRNANETDWDYYNHMVDSSVSSTATSSVTVQAATTTAVVTMDLTKDTFYAVRCISTEMVAPLGTDGESTCQISAEY